MFSDHSWHFLRLIGSFAEPPLAAIKKDKLFGSMEMKFSNFQLQRKNEVKKLIKEGILLQHSLLLKVLPLKNLFHPRLKGAFY